MNSLVSQLVINQARITEYLFPKTKQMSTLYHYTIILPYVNSKQLWEYLWNVYHSLWCRKDVHRASVRMIINNRIERGDDNISDT